MKVNDLRYLRLAVASSHPWIRPNRFPDMTTSLEPSTFRTLVSLLVADGSGQCITAYPAKLVSITEAQGEYSRATFMLPLPQGVRPPFPGPCALQFFDPAHQQPVANFSDLAAMLSKNRTPKRLAMLAALATNLNIQQPSLDPAYPHGNPLACWAEVEVFAIIRDSNPTALSGLMQLAGEAKEFIQTESKREVIKHIHNQYGEVVSVAHGPTSHCGTLHPKTIGWLEDRLAMLHNMGFYQDVDLAVGVSDIGQLPGVISGAMDGAQRLVELIERFSYESVLGRLTERYEAAEVERLEAEQREREAAFARSMKRRRRITLE